mmetsp:Transcript_3152/g.13172  ORF Transcript_3152/g.13172 Transcript_3152/m.13172 type:complete len:243 (+) Transcript_3152:434-1162(+)
MRQRGFRVRVRQHMRPDQRGCVRLFKSVRVLRGAANGAFGESRIGRAGGDVGGVARRVCYAILCRRGDAVLVPEGRFRVSGFADVFKAQQPQRGDVQRAHRAGAVFGNDDVKRDLDAQKTESGGGVRGLGDAHRFVRGGDHGSRETETVRGGAGEEVAFSGGQGGGRGGAAAVGGAGGGAREEGAAGERGQPEAPGLGEHPVAGVAHDQRDGGAAFEDPHPQGAQEEDGHRREEGEGGQTRQ